MASLLFLALSLSITGLMLSNPLLAITNQNATDSLTTISIHIFLFFLVPFTFFSAMVHLFFSMVSPQSAAFIKHLTMVTRVLVSSTLFLGVLLMIRTAVVPQDIPLIMLITATALTAVIYMYNPFIRYSDSAGQNVDCFTPAFVALCISIGTLLLIHPFLSHQNLENSLVPIPIQILLFYLNCFNFFLAMLLLFFHLSLPADGTRVAVPVMLIKILVELSLDISFAAVLIDIYLMIPIFV